MAKLGIFKSAPAPAAEPPEKGWQAAPATSQQNRPSAPPSSSRQTFFQRIVTAFGVGVIVFILAEFTLGHVLALQYTISASLILALVAFVLIRPFNPERILIYAIAALAGTTAVATAGVSFEITVDMGAIFRSIGLDGASGQGSVSQGTLSWKNVFLLLGALALLTVTYAITVMRRTR